MKRLAVHQIFTILFVLSISCNVFGQSSEAGEANEPVQVLTQDGYDKTVSSVVKLVSDAGRNIGNGVLVAVNSDGLGFVLTAYSAVAGRDKVAVILKNHPDALLGHIVERSIDYELDLAIVAVKSFPDVKDMITIGDSKAVVADSVYTAIAHFETRDWYPTPLTMATSDERFLIVQLHDSSTLEGAPLLLDDGKMIGLIIGQDTEVVAQDSYARAVKSNTIKPILNEWFAGMKLKRKWKEKGVGIAAWMWAVGGGVAAGVATVLVVSGGDAAQALSVNGLPGPPDPPQPQ